MEIKESYSYDEVCAIMGYEVQDGKGTEASKKKVARLVKSGELKKIGGAISKASIERLLGHQINASGTAQDEELYSITEATKKYDEYVQKCKQGIKEYIDKMGEKRTALKIEINELECKKTILTYEVADLQKKDDDLTEKIQQKTKEEQGAAE